MDDAPVLSIEGLWLGFGGLEVLRDVELTAVRDGITAVIGPNGAGKTALLNCINGIYRPDRGRIAFEGRELTDLSPRRIAHLGIARFFLRLRHDWGVSILWIEHDLQMVMELADRVHVLQLGRCIASGPPAEVRDDPEVLKAYIGDTVTGSA